MNLLVVVFLVVIVAAGYLATFVFDVALRVEERLVYGTVIGTIYVSTLGFALAWAFGMSRGSMIATMVLALALLTPTALAHQSAIAAEFADVGPRLRLRTRQVDSLRPVAILLVVSTIVSVRILSIAYTADADGGVSVGHLSTFGDWSAHLAYAGSFAFSENFPPELPTAAGESFSYHFGIDFFSSMFIPLGLSLPGSLEVSSGLLAVTFPPLMYLAALRFVSGRLAAVLATFVFLASGGTAALYRFFFEDLVNALESGGPGIGILGDLPRSYSFDGFDRNWVDNAVTGFLYPQRPTQIGFAITLVLLAMLWQKREVAGGRTHAAAGAIVAIMPIFHVFAFGVLVVMGIMWALIERQRRWLWYLGPAIVVGAPLVMWQLPAENGRMGHTFWMLGFSSWDRSVGDFFSFWLLNTGVFIPLAIWGMWRLRDRLGLYMLPILGLLLIPNVAIWHFWEGNNVKYLIFFLLLGAPFVGERLAAGFRGPFAYKALATVVVVSLTLSGSLDIWRAFEGSSGAYPAGYMSGEDVLVGEWARDNTEPEAVFASAASFTHPIRTIAGRTVLSGSSGRLRDLGVDWQTRNDDLRTIYGVFAGFDVVIDLYDVDYVVIGPQERRDYRPDGAPDDWDPAQFYVGAAEMVYDIGGYQVFDVRRYQS